MQQKMPDMSRLDQPKAAGAAFTFLVKERPLQ